ncbi:hypothetical protein [Streptomyces sp. cmx-18-6]|uniref:hypothetical protein n=1 Tax=Streptomyces sp. cmx-18-6 TaxID=2790930 RepID=UPI00397F8B31
MRTTVVRRTALAACAVSLTLLATACGGSSDAEGGKSGKGGNAAEGGGSAPKTSAKALSAAELETASLKQGDVAGQKITKAGPADEIPAGDVKADKEACLPVAHALAGVPEAGTKATTKRKVVTEPKARDKKSIEDMKDGEFEKEMAAAFDLTATLVALNTYEGTAGPDAFAAISKSATECAGGFTATFAGEKQKIVSIAEDKATGGDEAAGWTVTAEQDGQKMPFKLVALRKEGTVATFYSINLAAAMDKGAELAAPVEVVAAQAKKLG